ncbi:hypothetical protein L581_3958 [Serratia fonticola AU-AP2C]|nr:hypothetical protein L581_3958 [Serratia fonticola AU-AP2C]
MKIQIDEHAAHLCAMGLPAAVTKPLLYRFCYKRMPFL